MGESSCIGVNLSHAPEFSNGEGEVNIDSALSDSISFGRFMSDSLDWGKWSSFRHNRHLEEAGKYSTQGSVAQKKAYFEAHYKRIAAMKSAALQEQSNGTALQEQANGTTNDAPERESNDIVVDDGNHIGSSDTKADSEELSSEVAVNEAAEVETPIVDTDFLLRPNESNLDDEKRRSESGEAEKGSSTIEGEILVVSSLRDESTEIVDDVENENKDTEVVFSKTTPLEKQPLKESSAINQEFKDSAEKKPRIPILKSSVHRSSRLPPLASSNDRNKSTPKSLHMSMNFTQCQGGTTPLAAKSSPKVVTNSSKASQNCLHPLKTPIKASSNGLPKEASRTPQSEKIRSKSPSQQTLSGRRKTDAELLSVGCSRSPSTKGIRACTQIVSSSLRFRTDERAEKRKEFFLNLEGKAEAKEAKKPQIQDSSKSKEASKWHKRLYPYFTTLQEFYEGKNSEQRRSRTSGDSVGTPSVQPLSSSPSRKAHNDLEELQVKDPDSQFVDHPEILTTVQLVPPNSSVDVRSIRAHDRCLVKKTISNNDDKNLFMEERITKRRDKPRRNVEAKERGGQREDLYSINKCIVAFNQMHGFTSEEMVKATKVFKDSSNREVFLSLNEDQRGFWLKAIVEEL